MAEIFWRRKIKRHANKILLSLPDLPADIDDNVFIALGTQAAEADKSSKAYDEFLFSEEGYEQMPYEDSVDEVLTLQRARTAERRGRAELPIKMRIEYLEKLVEEREKDVTDAKTEKQIIDSQIAKEQEYLAGSRKGEEAGYWEGVNPDTTSRSKHAYEVLKEWIVFILVAGADAAIVIATIYAIVPTLEEAIVFAAPAIGVQILFPHLTGRAIANYRANKENNAQEFYIALGVGVAWLIYVFGMSVLRFNLLASEYKNRTKHDMDILTATATGIFTFLILVGLGTWILVRSMRANPHKNRISRLTFVFFKRNNGVRDAERALAKAKATLEAEQKILAEIGRQWDLRASVYDQVSESAKSVYRRALVNQVGSPEFTTQYLPEAKFKIRGSRKVAQ
jgi:hypothetical protein